MKQFIQYSKLLLIVFAIVGLTVGMSTITGCDKTDNDVQSTVKDTGVKTDVKEGKCGEGKCGGDDIKAAVSDKVDGAKESVKEAKCGEGKCGEGKCGGDDVKAAVSDKVDGAKESVKEAKCGEGKCG